MPFRKRMHRMLCMQFGETHLVGAAVQCLKQLRPLLHVDEPEQHLQPSASFTLALMHAFRYRQPTGDILVQGGLTTFCRL